MDVLDIVFLVLQIIVIIVLWLYAAVLILNLISGIWGY